MENEKHNISMLVELVLFPRIRAFNEDNKLDIETKNKKKQECIDAFIEECVSKYHKLTEKEISDVVRFVLDRTIKHRYGIDR